MIEGLDGSGGTTQVDLLVAAAHARGLRPVRTREPSDGPVGQLIRGQLAGGQVGDAVLPYLFAADRRDHLDRVVQPLVREGAMVISDRYALSSFAYQAAAAGLERVLELNRDFPAPDVTFLLELAPEACLDRIVRRGQPLDRFETLDRLRAVAAGYEAAITRTPEWPLVRIDASAAAEVVHQRIVEVLWPT